MMVDVWVTVAHFGEYEQGMEPIISVHANKEAAIQAGIEYCRANWPAISNLVPIESEDGQTVGLDADKARGISAHRDEDLHGGLHSLVISRFEVIQ